MFNRQKFKKVEKPSDQKFEDKVNPTKIKVTKKTYWSFPKERKRGFNIIQGKSTKNYRVQTKVIENSDENIG
tara:strand:- start:1209 stop:1424 length:216 start_codon:yes stop_codon:yes gene_type:complete